MQDIESVEFRVLGPLEVRLGDSPVPVRGWREHTVLALLLLADGEAVTMERLVEAVWNGDPPSGAVKAVRNCVSALRHRLATAAGPVIPVQATPAGYRLPAKGARLDARDFRCQAEAGRHLADAGQTAAAAAGLRTALALWRGPALAGIESRIVQDCAARLDEQRMSVLEECLDLELALAQHQQLISELQALASEYPLRERITGQLMLALYRSGRQAEALDAYHRLAKRLVGDLGLNASDEITRLHEAILRQDPLLNPPDVPGFAVRNAELGALDALLTDSPRPRAETEVVAALGGTAGEDLLNIGGGAVCSGGAATGVPRQLPAAAAGFIGRTDELDALTRLLDNAGDAGPGTVAISAIAGTAGVGKTALAVHWAHQIADRFPDGQLYVNLRGYDLAEPVPATGALAGFLRALGVPGQDIPAEADERAARYRSLLAGKQMLVVLDNAGSADQVRPLLPGAPACTVLVTSRDSLPGLVARDGAARIDLGLLPAEDAVALLRALIGARVDAEPAAAAELAAQCCRLPLALRVAAQLAASRPAVPLAGLTAELADLGTRLDLLEAGGDPSTHVRTVFSWSCRYLDPGAARTFRLLGLHPGPGFDPYGVAALTDTSVPQARQALDVLARAHLIQPAGPGRYSMHDLLRGYARELTNNLDARDEQHAALTHLFDHYLHAAAAAMDTLFPADRHRRPRIPRPAAPVSPLADPATAREWLDGERAVLIATARHSAAHDWPGHATRLAAILARYLRRSGHFPEALIIFTHALGAARRTGDRIAEATALNLIGEVDWEQGRFQHAADRQRQALALFRVAGDRAGEARALVGIGLAEALLGHYEQAARHQQEALAINRGIGNRFGEARALGHLGWIRQLQGRYQEAAGYYEQNLDLYREIGDREGEAGALAYLGEVDLRLGLYLPAAGYLQQALTLFQDMGSKGGEAGTLVRLGEVNLGLGRYEPAAGNFEQALAIFRETSDQFLQTEALNGLGEVLFQAGEPHKARAHHAAALRIASEAEAPREQARAHSGLARTCHAGGDPVQARHHWQQALTRYSAIGAPESDQVRAEIATIDRDQHPDGRTTALRSCPAGAAPGR